MGIICKGYSIREEYKIWYSKILSNVYAKKTNSPHKKLTAVVGLNFACVGIVELLPARFCRIHIVEFYIQSDVRRVEMLHMHGVIVWTWLMSIILQLSAWPVMVNIVLQKI